MIKVKRLIAIATASALISESIPRKAEANPLAIPAAAGCICLSRLRHWRCGCVRCRILGYLGSQSPAAAGGNWPGDANHR